MVIDAASRPSWEQFSTYLDSQAPVLVRLRGEPPVDLFVDNNGRRVGLRVAASDIAADALPDSPFTSLRIALVPLEDGSHLEVATTVPDLYPYFFAFAVSIADGIQVDGVAPGVALRRSLRDWNALFEQLAMLTPERQLGLLGELWLLDRLVDVYGAGALDAWTGPKGEAHDFRIGNCEFEVKTTSGEHRSHMISSDSQLIPSPGRDLYLLSVQFADGGPDGRSLHEVIETLRSRMVLLRVASTLDRILESTFQLSATNLGHYTKKVQLRSRPYLVPIDESFPRITHADVLSLPRTEMVRVSDVRYRVDIEGLGWEDGAVEFLAVLPEGSS